MEPDKCSQRRTSSLPPGPSGLPVVGSLLEYEGPGTNLKWTEQYGPIYHVRMGPKNLVYLNTIELVEKHMEGCSGEQFLARPWGPAAFAEGLLFGSGEKWKSNKQAFMKAMHTKTLQRDAEASVQNELTIVLKKLHGQAEHGGLFKIGDTLLPACANAVSGFLLGESLPEDSPDREILHGVVTNLEGVDLNSPLVQFSLKHPKLCWYLTKFMCHKVVDIHGTSKRLQRLIDQWIYQVRHGFELTIDSHTELRGQAPVATNTPSLSTPTTETNAQFCDQGNQKCPCVTVPGHVNSRPPDSQTRSFADGVQNTTNLHRASPVLQRQNKVEYDHSGGNSGCLTLPSNLRKNFVASESLLSYKDTDGDTASDIIETQVQLSAFSCLPRDSGENQVKPVELPAILPRDSGEDLVEPVELPAILPVKDGCYSTQRHFQRHLGREMSVNVNHHSILQRILAQPEFSGAQGDEELLQSLVDLFFGGVTSVLSGLEFVLMHLSKNPTMQTRVQQEIASVLAEMTTAGQSDVKITWSMREKMPYLRACVTEGLRLGCVTPSSLPHVATVDAEIEGYAVPKGFFVMASIYSLHRDRREYADPEVFQPRRHLDAEGNFNQPRSYRPYGVGARHCVGEILAEMELFLVTAAILRDFEITSPPEKASEMKTHMRVVHRLQNFVCALHQRKSASLLCL